LRVVPEQHWHRSSSLNGVSVIVCAHDSTKRIRPTIAALARCEAEFPVEIIVVDNHSSDGTAACAADAWTSMRERS
jgi:glycosyltransferase involved in cell wall biosynthesis